MASARGSQEYCCVAESIVVVTILFSSISLAADAPVRSFCDGADLMFVDKEIWVAVAGNAHHAVVEVFDPAVDDFAVAQLYLHTDLAVAERAQIEGFLASVARRRRLDPANVGERRV